MQGRYRNSGESRFSQVSSRRDPESGLRYHSHFGYKGSVKNNATGKSSKAVVFDGKADIMIEAGRLAAEYLVSRGLISADILIQKGQGNVALFPNEVSDLRVKERERPLRGCNGGFQFSEVQDEDQMSLGDPKTLPSGSRRLLDDSLCGRFQINEVGMSGRPIGQDWGSTRSASIFQKKFQRAGSDESIDDFPPGYHGAKKLAVDVGGMPKAVDPLCNRKRSDAQPGSNLENYEFSDSQDSRSFVSSVRKVREPLLLNAHSEKMTKRNAKDDSSIDLEPNASFGLGGRESENSLWPNSDAKLALQDSEGSPLADLNKPILSIGESHNKDGEQNISGISPPALDGSHLTGIEQPLLNSFSNTRSSESEHIRECEQDDNSFSERRNAGDFISGGIPNVLSEENLTDEQGNSAGHVSKVLSPELGGSQISKSVEEEGELGSSPPCQREKLNKSSSFSEISFMHQQESPRWPPGFGGPDSMDAALPNERVTQYARLRYGFPRKENRWEATRRHFSRISQAEEYFHLHNLKAKQMFAQAKAKSQEGTITAGQESVEVEKDLMNIDSDIAVMSKDTLETDSVCQEEQDLVSVHSESSEEKLDHSRATTETMDDSDASISERLKACAEIALFALHNSSDTTQTTNTPGTESVIGSTTPEEGIVHSFFQKLFTDFPSLRKLYQSQDSTKGFDCLVCLSLSPANETKHESLLDLLEHVNSYTENTSMHKGYGSAIFEINGLGKSNSLVQFGGDTQLQTNLSFENQEGISKRFECEADGLKSDAPDY